MLTSVALSFTLPLLAFAAPALEARQSITALSTSQISVFKPYTFFASTGYCNPSTTINWSCGANCNANSDFKPVASGGDGSDVQFWFVGFEPTLNTVIVSHQGTDPSQFLADLTDADFFLTPFSSSLFPGLPSSLEGHNGFLSEHAKTATAILAAVQTTMSRFGTTSVTTVGHSLGAALSLIEAVYLPLHLPATTTFKTVLYGLPRVGNPAFAAYVDAHAHVTHINNKEDPVPILPGEFLGFAHPAGEVHITDANVWESCPGEDNASTLCTVGDVPTILNGNLNNHSGPYDGVTMGC